MGRPQEQMKQDLKEQLAVTDSRIYYDKTEFTDYRLPINSPGQDLTQRDVVRAVVEDVIKREGFSYQGGQDLERFVDKLFEKAKAGGYPVIDWDYDNKTKGGRSYLDPDQPARRGTNIESADGKKYEGYNIGVGALLQADIGNAISDVIDEKRATRYQDMKGSIKELNELAAKLDKVAEYANDHTLHGFTQIYSPLLDNAGKTSQTLKDYLRNQDYMKEADPMQALRDKVQSEYKILDLTHPNARAQKPEEIVAQMTGLNDNFKKQGEYMLKAISYLPGGGSTIAKVIGAGLEGREIFNEVASGKVTLQQAVEKRAEKAATELVADQIGKVFGGGGGKGGSDNIGVEKMKEFVSGAASDYVKESAKLYQKGAGADEYKTALADVLINNFAKTVGGSVKSIAGDDESTKKILDAAVKLGIEEPVKKLLEEAKKSELKPVSSLPQSTVDGVKDLKLAKVSTEDEVFKVAGALQASANRENVDVRKVTATKDGLNVVGFDADPWTNPGYNRTSPVNIDGSLAQTREQIAANVESSSRERQLGNTTSVEQEQIRKPLTV